MTKHWLNVENLLWLSLALALAGSLKHLASVFSLVDGDTILGWLQAVAIDIGLFALAYSIKIRRVANRDTKPLWLGVILFSAISIYGNLAYGLLAIEKVIPYWIVVSKPYVLAASLPVLVIFLSELLSDNYHYHKDIPQTASNDTSVQLVSVSNPTSKVGQEASHVVKTGMEILADMLASNEPKLTNKELAQSLGVSMATIGNWKRELAKNGKH